MEGASRKMEQRDHLERILNCGLIAIVRFDRADELGWVAKALASGGVDVVEFTMTTPNALDTIRAATREIGDRVLIGAGTVLDPETARATILCGAQFIVAPSCNPRVIETCHRYSKVVIPGALTPTEIVAAWEMGANLVKVFPASMGGPGYIKDVLAPLPQVRLVPTGGVDLENAGAFIRAGAAAVAVGGNLVDKHLVAAGDGGALTALARRFKTAVEGARHMP
jgi:2-dehydro-3-deoxyphosphogluconate aldolase / (4S)-4-hydroxy-2-oxoglutarate aldolase